ncbi:16S rRNA (uracil(1498)-N(3))-methyltransferase [Aestuariimicrobium soli]|uniref:16S rRNA (uracil(1498)-N(3))-methyltransferase n=1 Tax=Aestuariimicrobium soli TaxID=2035834 RepID=UPI003EBCB566
MTDPLFLGEIAGARVGSRVDLVGDEGRHAAVVKRLRVGESVLVADGHGSAVRGTVTETGKHGLALEVTELLQTPEPPVRFRAVQALAKGDRGELAIELLTEIGCDEIVAWQSHRSIVRWDAKVDKGLAKWAATAREATKQSRRFRVPHVGAEVLTTKQLAAALAGAGTGERSDDDLTLVLHEDATEPLTELTLPTTGRITVIVGPEGGIAPEELELLTRAGARPVVISDGVLRSSTAAAVAIAQLRALAGVRR